MKEDQHTLDGIVRFQHFACNAIQKTTQGSGASGNENATAVETSHSILILALSKGVGDGNPAELWPDCSARITVVVDGVFASSLAKWLPAKLLPGPGSGRDAALHDNGHAQSGGDADFWNVCGRFPDIWYMAIVCQNAAFASLHAVNPCTLSCTLNRVSWRTADHPHKMDKARIVVPSYYASPSYF